MYENLCIRCGKPRLVVKTWKENLGYSVVTATETACPDNDCQKIVTAKNKKQQARHDAFKKRTRQTFLSRRKKIKK